MSPLRELRYDRLTLTPRPRSFPLDRGAGLRDPFHPFDLFPRSEFLSRRAKSNTRSDAAEGCAAAAATSEYDADDDRWDEMPAVTPGEGIVVEECFSDDDDDDAQEDDDEDEDEKAAYVVGPDSIRFLPPVDVGSLVVFDRWHRVHVPSPWPWSYWSSRPEPWQRFYLDRGAGWSARSEKDLNEELWIAFLLDRGAGVRSRWWMDLERAFATSSSAGPGGIDDNPHSAVAKRRRLPAAEDDQHDPAGGGPAAAPRVHPARGQDQGSAEDRGRDGE